MTDPAPDDLTLTDFLDGNAAAGPLRELFAVDLTAALGRCVGCGRTGALGGVRAYAHAPGLVLRCPSCDTVLLRLVRDEGPPARTWLDLRGIAVLQVSGE
jgi:hypothetical protein